MLNACLNFLAGRVNQSLSNTYSFDEKVAQIAAPGDMENKGKTANKLLLFLGNLERDSAPQSPTYAAPNGFNRQVATNRPLYVAAYVVIAANFDSDHYGDGLSLLSYVLAFFNQYPLFTHTNAPDLPAQIERIALEPETLSLESISQLWGMLGSHYLPSVIYKIRLFVPDSEKVLAQNPLIQQSDISIL